MGKQSKKDKFKPVQPTNKRGLYLCKDRTCPGHKSIYGYCNMI